MARPEPAAIGAAFLWLPAAWIAVTLACSLALAGCAEETPAAAPAPVVARPAATATVQPAGLAPAAPVAGALLPNDPSAPADTPLCGVQAREIDAIGQTVLARQYADAGECRSFACYDPATATYIGADGYRHVCR